MPSLPRQVRRLFTYGRPIVVLLVTALGLVAWLGYEALDAAASHRRTAEAVLRDYALVSATQLARNADSELDDVIDEVLEPVLRRARSDPTASPSIIRREMDDGAREAGCECPSLRSPLILFRVDPSDEVAALPERTSDGIRSRLAELVAVDRIGAGGDGRSALVTSPAGDLLDEPVAVGFMSSEAEGGASGPTFGFVVAATALEELFEEWYHDERLLPEAIVGDVPNDSVLHVWVEAPAGLRVFTSSSPIPETPGASVALPEGPRFGNLVVHATVQPDAAARLVIGGLPQSRLPLLAALLLLTLGVGAAAVIQLRREQGFQRLREDFVSSVSHELRTPLAQIRLFSELQEAGKLPSAEDRSRATSIIAREARRLTHLVDNILQFSSLRRAWGRGMPEDRLDLGNAISEGLDSVTPLLEAGDMKLEVSVAPQTWVDANEEALTRIVVNLLDNAIKYGPRGQTISVGVSRVDGVARLTVEDEGPGVPAADRDRVWKPFRRLDRDMKTHVQGSGIGLAVVGELVSFQDGRVWVDDAKGGGARFVVELPLANQALARGEVPVVTGAPE